MCTHTGLLYHVWFTRSTGFSTVLFLCIVFTHVHGQSVVKQSALSVWSACCQFKKYLTSEQSILGSASDSRQAPPWRACGRPCMLRALMPCTDQWCQFKNYLPNRSGNRNFINGLHSRTSPELKVHFPGRRQSGSSYWIGVLVSLPGYPAQLLQGCSATEPGSGRQQGIHWQRKAFHTKECSETTHVLHNFNPKTYWHVAEVRIYKVMDYTIVGSVVAQGVGQGQWPDEAI